MAGIPRLAGGIAVAALLCASATHAATYELNGLLIGIDDRSGCITSLVFPQVGTILSAPGPSAGLVDLAFPVDAFSPMRLGAQFSVARVTRAGQAITVVHDRLGASRDGVPLPPGAVTATVQIRPAADGKSVIVSCRLENKSGNSIPQVLFPDLRGLQPFAGVERTQLRFGRGTVEPFAVPLKPPHTTPFFGTNDHWAEYPPSGYYGLNTIRWIDMGSLAGGLSVFQRKWGTDDRPSVLTRRTELDPMNMRLCWSHAVDIKPGQSWDSGEFWFTPHRGGWAKGIEPYREYVNQVYQPRELPSRVRDGIGFRTVWESQAIEPDPDYASFRYSDLPRVARDAKEHGIDELVSWAPALPFVLPLTSRTELGGRAAFADAVREAKSIGVNLQAFVSIQLVVGRLAEKYGTKISGTGWTYHQDLVRNFNPPYAKANATAPVQPDNEAWRKDAEDSVADWISAGISSFGWDVADTRHYGHPVPALVDLIRRVRAVACARDPQATFSGESVTPCSLEWDGLAFDYTWNWVDYVDATPTTSLLRAPRLNCNVEDSALVVKKAFIDNLYLNVFCKKPDQPNGTALIAEVPAVASALKEVLPLRRQFLRYFTEGILIGDSVLSFPSDGFVRGYLLPGRLLVLALNAGEQSRAITLQSEPGLWLPLKNEYDVIRYDGAGRVTGRSQGAGPWTGTTPELKSLELGIFELVSR